MALAAAISNYLSHRREESRNSGRTVCSAPLPYSEETVKKTVAENPVVVYSKTWCTYCSEVKSLFKKLSVEPLVVELDKLGSCSGIEESHLEKTLERLTGKDTVPNIFIGGNHIGGCADILKLHHKGELEPLLLESGGMAKIT